MYQAWMTGFPIMAIHIHHPASLVQIVLSLKTQSQSHLQTHSHSSLINQIHHLVNPSHSDPSQI